MGELEKKQLVDEITKAAISALGGLLISLGTIVVKSVADHKETSLAEKLSL